MYIIKSLFKCSWIFGIDFSQISGRDEFGNVFICTVNIISNFNKKINLINLRIFYMVCLIYPNTHPYPLNQHYLQESI